MDNNTFELFLKTCGTERFAATLLGITQPHISQIRNGYRELSYEKAILIADYLKEKLKLDINPVDLISDSKKNKFRLSKRSLFSNIPITYGKLDLRKLVVNKNNRFKKFKEKSPIIIDEFNHLISGEETYFYYLSENKKVVDGYKFHLQKLVNQGFEKTIRKYIVEEFDLIARTKLAQRVENLVSERRGNPVKKDSNVHNSAHLVLPQGIKTRNFVSELFNLGNHNIYTQLKKIISHENEKIINQVRQEEITPHAAYQLIKFEDKPFFTFRSLLLTITGR